MQRHKSCQILRHIWLCDSLSLPQTFSTITWLTLNGSASSIQFQCGSYSPSQCVRFIHESGDICLHFRVSVSQSFDGAVSQSTVCISFRPSSGEVFLWKSAKVPALQCLVHSINEGVNHLPHGTSEWVKGGAFGPWTFEMPVLVAVSTKQPLLGRSDVQECRDETELWEQSPLQLFVMHHQQAAPPLQPAQSVRCPPGGVAWDKFRPFCRFRENTGGTVVMLRQRRGSVHLAVLSQYCNLVVFS